MRGSSCNGALLYYFRESCRGADFFGAHTAGRSTAIEGGDVTIMKTTLPGAFAVTALRGDLGSRDAVRVVAVQSSTAGSFSLVAELSAALILEGSGS